MPEDSLQLIAVKNPRQAAWVLFHKELSALTEHEQFGLSYFDTLLQLGYVDPQAAFIVNKTLDWAHKEMEAKRPAIVQLVDQRFLTFFGDPLEGFQAWDIELMESAPHHALPQTPLISLAISLSELARRGEEELLNRRGS